VARDHLLGLVDTRRLTTLLGSQPTLPPPVALDEPPEVDNLRRTCREGRRVVG